MSEMIQNDPQRKKALREIIDDLHDEADVKKVKKRFDRLIRDVSPEEIASMEQELISEGVPVEHIQKLCEVHVSVFETALKSQPGTKVLPGHPVDTYREENRELKKILRLVKGALKSAVRSSEAAELEQLFEQLKKVEIHYQRKENQLFPYLEDVGFSGPSKVMWGKHDEIRAALKRADRLLQEKQYKELKKSLRELSAAMKRMIFMEEKILFPTAQRKLPETVWAKIRRGEASIGYAWIKPGNLWDSDIIMARNQEAVDFTVPGEGGTQQAETAAEAAEELISLEVGELTVQQINLMLTHLPLDITYVDEHDKVRYFSAGKERHFPRSPGIIGRSVQNCHPPKSVHVVEKIVESFRKREKTSADFWLQMGEKLIYIRYFPIFDADEVYRGVLEVTQEISAIKAIEGERKLLDW